MRTRFVGVLVGVGVGVAVACASAGRGAGGATPARAVAPPDVSCEWHEGRCAYWHPCGEGPVGESTCWDDCDPKQCRAP